MRNALAFCFILNIYFALAEVTDYYWREYHGYVPSDAFEAGVGCGGRAIFVGQVFHGGKVLPGTITRGSAEAQYLFIVNTKSTSENVKILCTNRSHKLKWVRTCTSDVNNMDKSRLVLGGNQGLLKIFIGRVIVNGGHAIGKVICNARGKGCIGRFPNHKGRMVVLREYEILSYNQGLDIDVRTLI